MTSKDVGDFIKKLLREQDYLDAPFWNDFPSKQHLLLKCSVCGRGGEPAAVVCSRPECPTRAMC